uniref:Uncharacterized protein n=1 Tax=Populus alba TaxID=43335 RepID=A0A4U5QKV2_POPAL|nr:hypothetical protein D5086_0000074370 [Populus alba]
MHARRCKVARLLIKRSTTKEKAEKNEGGKTGRGTELRRREETEHNGEADETDPEQRRILGTEDKRKPGHRRKQGIFGTKQRQKKRRGRPEGKRTKKGRNTENKTIHEELGDKRKRTKKLTRSKEGEDTARSSPSSSSSRTAAPGKCNIKNGVSSEGRTATAITTGVLSAVSDIVAQKLSGIQKLQIKRILLKVGKKDTATVAKKVAVEQLTASPWNNLVFMIDYEMVIDGKSVSAHLRLTTPQSCNPI